MIGNKRTELLRRAALEDVIASGKMEDPVFTSKMHDLLERKSLDSVTDVEFDREVLTIPLSDASALMLPRWQDVVVPLVRHRCGFVNGKKTTAALPTISVRL